MRLLFVVILTASFLSLDGWGFAKNMPHDSSNYSLVETIFNALQLNASLCDKTALEDPISEWRCASYSQDHMSFIPLWQAMLEQYPEIPLLAISEWRYLAKDDGSVDFYTRAYQLPYSQLVVAYDPSENGREVFVGISDDIGQIMQHTTGSINRETLALEADEAEITMTDMLVDALMSDFLTLSGNEALDEAVFTTEATNTETQLAQAIPTQLLSTPTNVPQTVTQTNANKNSSTQRNRTPTALNPYTTVPSSTASPTPETRLFINSPDYDYCAGFASQQAAQYFYDQQGFSPDNDPYNLDNNKNGTPCEDNNLN